jgi:hypothetical protein
VLLRGPICFDHNSLYTGTKESCDIIFPLECPEHPVQDEPTPSSLFLNSIISGYSSSEARRMSDDDGDVYDNPWREED